MQIQSIDSFSSFCSALRKVGFSMGGSNNEGIFSICDYFSNNLVFHTGDAETDPWIWRIRGITECNDLAYSKLFFNKGGWITKKWYPYFISICRENKSFNDMYYDGLISNLAKRIYDLVSNTPNISLYEIKMSLGLDKSQKSKIDSAITLLQMKMFITISGQKYKLSKAGEKYGWPVTTFCRTEDFFGKEVFALSDEIDQQEAINRVTEQVYKLNPNANNKTIVKFLGISKK